MPNPQVVESDMCLQIPAKVSWQQMLSSIHNGDLVMKRLVAAIVLSIALLTSGAVVTQSSLVGTAYAESAGGGE
jgi:hypothetical protein